MQSFSNRESACRPSKRLPFSYLTVRMVEGHQCHRVVHAHRKVLLGQRFKAESPNGKFIDGEHLRGNEHYAVGFYAARSSFDALPPGALTPFGPATGGLGVAAKGVL